MTNDLIATARRLAKASPRRPRQADLKRAVSTAYYALFHALAKNGADLLVGVGAKRPEKAWTQVYRALNHGDAKKVCTNKDILRGISPSLRGCAGAFVELQEARHKADYDPGHRISRAEALARIDQAEQAVRDLREAPRQERFEFATVILFKARS